MQQQIKSASTDTSLPSYRVKVYWLDTDGKWEDKGTGFCVYLEGSGSDPDEIFVRSEINDIPLLRSTVLSQRLYQRQQDTLLVWSESDNEDLALSFQEAEGCEEIWHRICSRQDGDKMDDPTHLDTVPNTPTQVDTPIQINETLPEPKVANLKIIERKLVNATPGEKDDFANSIIASNFIDKLTSLFQSSEKARKIKRLHTLYTIMKSIIMLNDNTIIEYIVNDDIIMNVAGMLEYDVRTPKVKANHRQVLEKQSKMELVVPLNDETALSKMRQTFRLQYLKDVILAKDLDESLTSVLQSLLLFYHSDIIGHIQHNSKFLSDLFSTLNRPDATDVQKVKVVQFVLQMCSISKSLQGSSRSIFYRTLAPHGLLDIFEVALQSEDEGMRTAGVEALNSIVELDVSLVRSHILDHASFDENSDKKNLLECILSRFTMANDSGLKFQYTEILKMILESNSNSPAGNITSKLLRKQSPDVEDILGLFYDKYSDVLLRPLQNIDNKPMNLDGPIELLEYDHEQSEVYSHLIDFLCFLVQQHGFRSKYLMLSSDCFPKMTQLYRSRQYSIKLGALRFFRTCIGLLDDFYNRHLIKHNIFESTIRLLLDTDGKSNLMNSACLELLEFIRKENPKLLVTHLIERFGSVLDTVDYISTCKLLRSQYNENYERAYPTKTVRQVDPVGSGDDHGNNDTRSSSSLDQYEEAYFNESDDEDDPQEDNTGSKDTTELAPALKSIKRKRNHLDGHDDDDEEDEEDDDDEDGIRCLITKVLKTEQDNTEGDETAERSLKAGQNNIDNNNKDAANPPPVPKITKRNYFDGDDSEDEDEDDSIRSLIAKALKPKN